MRNFTSIGIGTAIGIAAYYVVRKFEKKTNVKAEAPELQAKEVEVVQTNDVVVEEKTAEAPVEEVKEAKDKTLDETIRTYTDEGNVEMVSKIKEVVEYLDENGIYHDPKIGENGESKTIAQLCRLVTAKNNSLKKKYDDELEQTKNTILVKSTRKLVKLIHLPEEIQVKGNRANNIAVSRTIRLKHIDESKQRIDRITKKFTVNSLRILEKDYFQMLYNLVQMHKDLVLIGKILPSLDNDDPSVNVIADDNYNHNRKKFLNYMEDRLSPEEFEFLTKQDKSLAFEEYK